MTQARFLAAEGCQSQASLTGVVDQTEPASKAMGFDQTRRWSCRSGVFVVLVTIQELPTPECNPDIAVRLDKFYPCKITII